jgi:hypothetical protein
MKINLLPRLKRELELRRFVLDPMIAAGAVVTSAVPGCAVVAGVPARVIRMLPGPASCSSAAKTD